MGLAMIRIWLRLVRLRKRTVVIWNTTWVWQSKQCMHISVIRSYLFSNLDIYPLLRPSPDMICWKGLNSAVLFYPFIMNCHYLALSHSQSEIYFFEGYMNSPVLYPPWDNPYGIHGMGGGFQKFQMESMEWGMDSIIFPWNGGWTPYFFKMESMEWGMDSMNWGMDSILF